MAQTRRNQIEAAQKRLEKYGQQHLLRFVSQLEPNEQDTLLQEIDSLDFEVIQDLIDTHVKAAPPFHAPKTIEPAQAYPIEPDETAGQKYEKARARGEQLVAQQKVAAFVVAGGAGTRLNYDGPKGNVPATPLRNKTLFRVFAEGILAIQRKYNSIVPWYVMTSTANHVETLRIFKDNNYFGLDSDNVMLFPQGMMPVFDQNGKILLDQKGRLTLSPDGHGGSLRALYKSGATADMAKRGIEYISYFQVDNPLAYVVDPLFIGLHALDRADMSSKAVLKCEPLEKVGNFTLADGKVTVIEYSDLPEELALQKTDDGKLKFELGSIAIHVINRTFVEKINKHGFSLPWHQAVKRVPFLNGDGIRVDPAEPNAVKLESFVFDALPLADKSVILTIDRNEEFAPIKNASGVDSLESSQRLQISRAARWMERAGIDIPRRDDQSPDLIIEISPLFAPDSDTLIQKRNQLRPLHQGDMVYLG